MNFWGKLWKAWRQSHGLFKVGMVGWVLTLVADYTLIYATPVAMWNGPRHVREQVIVTTVQAASMMLMIVGWGLRLRRQMRTEREDYL